MREIIEIVAKIPPVIETALSFYQKNTSFFQTQDVVYNLQMAWYWWKDVANTAASMMDGNIVKDSAPISVDFTPTLLSGGEQLAFMESRIKELVSAASDIKDDSFLPPRMLMWMEHGIASLKEAEFNVRIIRQVYGKGAR